MFNVKTNCRNCGAVLTSATCEYCGTRYADYDGSGRFIIKYDATKFNATERADFKAAFEKSKREPVLLFSNNVIVDKI